MWDAEGKILSEGGMKTKFSIEWFLISLALFQIFE
jgi:hypothetical protein